MASKNKTQEILNEVAEDYNGAEKLFEASKVVYDAKIELTLLQETAKHLSFTLMELNDLHKGKYDKERRIVWDLKRELNDVELEEGKYLSITYRFRVQDTLKLVRRAVLYGENYHRDF